MKTHHSATILLLLITACSTAPRPQEEVVETKNKAVEYAEYGNGYYRQGLYGKAIESFELSLAYNGSVDNQPGLVSSYNSLGKVNLAAGKLDIADSYFLQAFELAEELGDGTLMAQSRNHQGELAMQRQEYDSALEHYRQAWELASNGAPKRVKAVISGNLGSVYRKLEQPEAALEAFQRAVDLNTEEKAFEELATSYYRIAALYTEQGDYTLALEYVAHALENDKKVENSVGIAKDYFAMGRIWRKAGDEERAYASLERSLLVYHSLVVLFPGLSLEGDIRVLLENLVELAESLGEEQAAANYRRILSGDEE